MESNKLLVGLAISCALMGIVAFILYFTRTQRCQQQCQQQYTRSEHFAKRLSLAVVVPTIRRKHNNFKYLDDTLSSVKNISNNNNIDVQLFVYCDHDDIPDVPSMKYVDTILYREDAELPFEKASYDWWRSKLCFDFIKSMSMAMKHKKFDWIMRLEDDTVLDSEYLHPIINAKPGIYSLYHSPERPFDYAGYCSIVFSRKILSTFLKIVKQNYLKDIPLDLMTDNEHKLTIDNFPKKYAYHKGEISSREDSIVERKLDVSN